MKQAQSALQKSVRRNFTPQHDKAVHVGLSHYTFVKELYTQTEVLMRKLEIQGHNGDTLGSSFVVGFQVPKGEV